MNSQQPAKANTIEDQLTVDRRADIYLELYKQQMAYFHETRRIEFQANIALWGAIFAIGYALAGKVHPKWYLSLAFVVFTVILSATWAIFPQKTKRFDKSLFSEYRTRIERLLGTQPFFPEEKLKFPKFFRTHAWWLFYAIATLLFSLSVVIFLQVIPVK